MPRLESSSYHPSVLDSEGFSRGDYSGGEDRYQDTAQNRYQLLYARKRTVLTALVPRS
jgi:hypothetical protein